MNIRRITLLSLALLAATVIFGGEQTFAAELFVDNDLVQCPTAAHTTIQAAVNAAAPGDIISVCPGVYDEQVTVNKSVTVRGIRINNLNRASIKPSPVAANTTSLTSGAPMAAVLLVENATGVLIDNMTVDGADNGLTGCAPTLIGVYFRNASGTIQNSAVKNMKLGSGLEGCQGGLGVFVQSGNSGSSNVTVTKNTVHDYQKNGITANEAGTVVTVSLNLVNGSGPNPIIAQNGVQLAFGATGTVTENLIANHIYSPCTTPENCAAASANILLFSAGSNILVNNNRMTKSQSGVLADGVNAFRMEGNYISDTDVFDGVYLAGDDNFIDTNQINNSDEAAIFVDGSNNKVHNNRINDAPIGVAYIGSTNIIRTTNRYFNTDENVVEITPALAATSAAGTTNNTAGGRGSLSRP